MMLGPRENQLYARHLLLPEIGEAGQAKLLASRVAIEGAGAAAVAARTYLERSGCTIDPDGASIALSRDGVVGAIEGAFAAVEHIKRTIGVGTPASFPGDLFDPETRDEP